jgi:CheY-like chemotaxis protein
LNYNLSIMSPSMLDIPLLPERVLVVDDNADCLSTTAELLRMSGCEVRTATNGADAVAAVQVFSPEVILLDLAMPDMDGYAVAKAIRADAGNAGIFIAAVTGLGRSEDKARSAANGVDIHLIKPVAFDELLGVLRAAAAIRKRTQLLAPAGARRQHTILVVDDTAAHRYSIVRGLSSAGFRVLEASTGAEGVAMATMATALVLDLHLPDFDGREVARRLRASWRTAQTPIVHHSSLFVTDEDVRECRSSGGDAFVASPVSAEVLAGVVEQVIQQRAA